MRKRIASAMLACAASMALPSLGQNPAAFDLKTSATNSPSDRKLYLAGVEFNGASYIVDVSNAQPAQISVWVSNGDGTFQQTWFYQFPSGRNAIPSITSGDLGNGNLDLIAVLGGTNQVAYFEGESTGRFMQPQFVTINLPLSSPSFDGRGAVMADFTGDGKVDLVTSAGSRMVLLPGQGDPLFGPARIIYTAPNSGDSVGWSTQLGDFDADGKADFAFTETNCTVSPCSPSTLHVEYGDGSGNFTDTTPYSTTGYVFQFNTGDLNNDGRTDIAGISESGGVPQLIALYGQSSRTFALHTLSSGLSSTSSLRNPPVIGDFNGDGANDIAAIGTDSSQPALTLFLGNNAPGTFLVETIPLSVPLPDSGVGLGQATST